MECKNTSDSPQKIRPQTYVPGFVALCKQDVMTIGSEVNNNKHFLSVTSHGAQPLRRGV
jgi:hypothetical protein